MANMVRLCDHGFHLLGQCTRKHFQFCAVQSTEGTMGTGAWSEMLESQQPTGFLALHQQYGLLGLLEA